MIKHLSKRERWITGVTLVVLLTAGSDRYVVRPLVDQVRQQLKTVHAREMKLSKDMHVIAQKTSIEEKYTLLSRSFSSSLTPEEEIARLFESIEVIGQRAGVELLDMKPLPMRDHDVYQTFHIELECEGQMQELARFLKDMADSGEGLKIRKMRLGAHRNQPGLRSSMQVSKIRFFDANAFSP